MAHDRSPAARVRCGVAGMLVLVVVRLVGLAGGMTDVWARVPVAPPLARARAVSPVLATAHLPAAPITILPDPRTRRTFVVTSIVSATRAGIGVSVLDAVSGHLLHSEAFYQQGAFGGADVDPQGGQVFVLTGFTGDTSGQVTGPTTLRILNGTTGAVERILPAGQTARNLAVDGLHHRLFIFDYGLIDPGTQQPAGPTALRILALPTGRLVRTIATEAVSGSFELAVDPRRGRLVLTGADTLSVLDEATGTPVVTATVPNGGLMAFDERSGLAFVENANGEVVNLEGMTVVDTRTGAVRRNVGGSCQYGPIAVDSVAGRVLCLDFSENSTTAVATLQTLDPHSGHAVRTQVIFTSPPLLFAMAVDEGRGHTLIVTGSDVGTPVELDVFDTRSGRLLRDLTVGPGPYTVPQPPTIGVDTPDGRVYVGDGNNNTVVTLDAARL